MVHQIFSLFQITLTTLIQNKFEFLWQKNIPFSEWNDMPYWEFEAVIKMMNERNKEENERQKSAEKQKQQASNIPNMGNFKIPNMPNMPKF
jgi:hypothetical protein